MDDIAQTARCGAIAPCTVQEAIDALATIVQQLLAYGSNREQSFPNIHSLRISMIAPMALGQELTIKFEHEDAIMQAAGAIELVGNELDDLITTKTDMLYSLIKVKTTASTDSVEKLAHLQDRVMKSSCLKIANIANLTIMQLKHALTKASKDSRIHG